MGKKRPREYVVEDIVDLRINRETLVAEFCVKWEHYEKKHNTWEPIEHIYMCPIMLRELEERKKAKANRSARDKKEAPGQLGNIKEIEQVVLDKFKDPQEFIPTGRENVEAIMWEKKSDMGNCLWLLSFTNDHKPCWVRKSVVCYYWPFDAALFLHMQVDRAAKLKRGREALEKKRLNK